MSGLIDIHSHILPGVDDGAEDSQVSIEMLQIAWKDGIRTIIFTPHYKPMRHNVSPATMKRMTEELFAKSKAQGMEFEFFMGNEIYYHNEIVNGLENGEICTLANSEYVLIEFNPMDEFDYIRNGIYQVMAGGYRPILAHAERYVCLLGKEERVEDLAQMGCYIQINTGSIMGNFGFTTKQFVKKLLKHRMVHFVATDAHDIVKRTPRLSDCAKYISKKYSEDYKKILFYENPLAVITNEYI